MKVHEIKNQKIKELSVKLDKYQKGKIVPDHVAKH